jgi:prophage regulatory protein
MAATFGSLRILRRRAVEAESGFSCSELYRRVSRGLWPRPVSLGARAVGWPEGEVALMNAARIAGKSEAEIRLLVSYIQAARAKAMSGAN